MKVLLDTHTFHWFINGDNQLSRNAREIIEDLGNERVVSIVSLWEIAIKIAIDKMRLVEPFDVMIPAELERNIMTVMDLTVQHVSLVARLPLHHTDPFDRVLMAQAIVDELPVVSVDSKLDAYGVERLW